MLPFCVCWYHHSVKSFNIWCNTIYKIWFFVPSLYHTQVDNSNEFLGSFFFSVKRSHGITEIKYYMKLTRKTINSYFLAKQPKKKWRVSLICKPLEHHVPIDQPFLPYLIFVLLECMGILILRLYSIELVLRQNGHNTCKNELSTTLSSP